MPEFSVTTPAADITLLGTEELRVAAGLSITDTSNDDVLAAYEEEIAAEIMSDCGIADDGIHPRTLRSEICSDVFREDGNHETLYLSRRHVTAVSSINENGTLLAASDWIILADSGRLLRVNNDDYICWPFGKIVVVYTAGFADVPATLKAEAKARVKIKYSEGSRDPLARTIRTELPDIETREVSYQVGGLSRLTGYGLADESERRLKRFMTHIMVG